MARFQEIKVGNDSGPAAGLVSHVNLMDHLDSPLNPCGMDLAAEARVPKARKPYTISKQREKWTEDEHKMFLEALQLHGRAWRRIQEHIGSKTAVQIRSHAQKFFSKVIRESSGDSNYADAAPPIHIPPPRPKRKPAHPYPRKLGNSPGKDVPAFKRLVKSQLHKQPLCEQENCSPKSVLSPARIGSEILASDSSGSPASWVDLEERCPTPSTTAGELGVQVPPSKDANGNTACKDLACGIPEGPFFRLFGKRLVVNDLDQQPNSNTGSLQDVADMELDASAETPTSGTGKFSSHSAAEANTWSPWFMYYLPQGEVFPVHSGHPFFSYNPQAVASSKQQHQPSQAANCKFMNREETWTESNSTSSSMPETTRNSDYVESVQVSNDKEETRPVPSSRKCVSPAPVYLRGFVPYKKCGVESTVLKLLAPSQEADGEMTRLCL